MNFYNNNWSVNVDINLILSYTESSSGFGESLNSKNHSCGESTDITMYAIVKVQTQSLILVYLFAYVLAFAQARI